MAATLYKIYYIFPQSGNFLRQIFAKLRAYRKCFNSYAGLNIDVLRWLVNQKDFNTVVMILNCLCVMVDRRNVLTIQAPTQQNGQTHSNNSSAFVDELFECVWLFCGVGA